MIPYGALNPKNRIGMHSAWSFLASRWAVYVAAVTLACGAAFGRLPEPDAVWWGTMTHNNGQALSSSAGSPISVVAKLNGVVVAQNAVPAGSATYVLKVPLDDGIDPRVPGTVRPGERIHIFLRNTASNTEYETLATRTGPTSNGVIGSTRGTVYSLNLTVPENLNTTGALMAAFAVWAQGFPAINPGLPNRDSYRKGVSDLESFLSGTDPTDPNDRFRILEVARSTGVNSIRYGPLRLGRVYSIYYTPTLDGPVWQRIGGAIPPASVISTWFDHAIPIPAGFYRVEVGIQ